MAYEVTATKRRPQRFEDLVGQEFVVTTLKNAIQSGKIAHAYLFSGPRGCGKTSSARILAKTLNCEHGPIATPCEECSQCKEITKGASLDVIEIDGASNTSVNDIRQIKDEILFPPQSGRYKIYIIDEVHMLSNSAFNALLKTIEEPPEYVIFIFATTELHKVPATIKSRCQQFNFRLGSVDQIKDLLAKAADELGIKYEDEALFWVAREATGSFRDAYTLFDQVVSFSENFITYEKIRKKLGLVGVESLNEISEFCVDGNSKEALEKIDELLTNGVSIEQFVSNFADYLRSLLLIESGIQKESLLGQNIERYSKKVLENWNRFQLERALSLFLNLYRDIRYSLSPRYETELAVSRLCWLSQYVSNVEVKKAIDGAKNLLLTSSSVKQETQENQVANNVQNSTGFKMPPFPKGVKDEGNQNPFQNSGYQSNVNSAMIAAEEEEQNSFTENNDEYVRNNPSLSIEQLKEELVRELKVKQPIVSTLLAESSNWVFENGVITIEVSSPYLLNQVKKNAVFVSNLISQVWGRNVQFYGKFVQKTEEKVMEVLPNAVKIVCDGMYGEVVSVTAISKEDMTFTKKTEKQTSNESEENSEQINENEDIIEEEENDEF